MMSFDRSCKWKRHFFGKLKVTSGKSWERGGLRRGVLSEEKIKWKSLYCASSLLCDRRQWAAHLLFWKKKKEGQWRGRRLRRTEQNGRAAMQVPSLAAVTLWGPVRVTLLSLQPVCNRIRSVSGLCALSSAPPVQKLEFQSICLIGERKKKG